MTELKRYESAQDVHMRLDGTYVRYQGDVYLCAHEDQLKVTLYNINTRNPAPFKSISANDPDLDVSSVPLGYCNFKDYAPLYLAREAARKQKQGVSLHALVGFDETRRQWLRPPGKSMHITHMDIYKTIKGDYPDIMTVINNQNHPHGGAFHRRLALVPFTSGRWKLKYMTNFVGILRASDMTIRLTRSHRGNSFLLNALAVRGVTVHD